MASNDQNYSRSPAIREDNVTSQSDGTTEERADGQALPIEQDIMQLARLGEVGAIQRLFEAGQFDAKYRDEQGITPLHWAAIKNHYALCHFLIQSGADINAKGGDVAGTPVLWAARSCNYYVVNLLLQEGADPLLPDDQGFNLLQNATMDGNVFQILLLLHYHIPVDVPDSKGHTSLMWAAYKGYPNVVEILLKWGASVAAKDEGGFTALHWSLVKGSYGCIQKLIEYGSDRFVKTSDGKTPTTCAQEMNSTTQWHLALAECGFNPNGSSKSFPLPSIVKDRYLFIWRFFFLWPFFILFCCFAALSHLPIFFGLPLALTLFFFMQYGSQRLLKWGPSNIRHIHHTPFLAGIFAGSLFWVGVQWIGRILLATWTVMPLTNLLFLAFYLLCSYFYFTTMLEDPGFVPKGQGRSEQKAVVQRLVTQGNFDERHFCTACMNQKPLRSKHCRRCSRCVAKQDHHCPWVDNCVAINNHRHFLYYVVAMEIGVALLIWLNYNYFSLLPPSGVTDCNVLSSDFCDVLNKDPFTMVTVTWTAFQLIWVTMLLSVQLVQISRATTTLEQMKGFSHASGPGAMATAAIAAGSTSLEGAEITSSGMGPDPPAVGYHKHRGSWWEHWKRLLGIDTFVATAIHGSKADEVTARQRQNPFTRGCLTNCKDFFCDPAPVFGRRENGEALLGGEKVDYTSMFEPPPHTMMRKVGQEGHDGVYTSVGTDEHV